MRYEVVQKLKLLINAKLKCYGELNKETVTLYNIKML